MMDRFASYTPCNIFCISEPRRRVLFRGITSGAKEPAVRRAFCVLYEDVILVRIAGRTLYNSLTNTIDTSIMRRKEEDARIVLVTGMSKRDLDEWRKIFLAMKCREEVMDRASKLEIWGDLLEGAEVKNMDFEGFMIRLQPWIEDEDADEKSHQLEIVRMMSLEEQEKPSVTQKKKKSMDRYDYMVEKFIEWEDRVPPGEGRRFEIIRGCFVGARIPEVVGALKIVYTDYAALKVAGDFIFKLVENLIESGSTH